MSSDNLIWQDKEIRFDILKQQTIFQKGEVLLGQTDHIEDYKGNAGETGTLQVTNLRIIWYQKSDPRVNLSIGYECIINVELKTTFQQSVGTISQLHVKGKNKTSRFEFIFRSMLGDSPKIFSIRRLQFLNLKVYSFSDQLLVYQNVQKSYENTKLYREMKTRGGDIVKDKNPVILPQENIINKFNNVQSVGQEQASKGALYQTNVRIIWYSFQNEQFNISIPWINIKSVSLKKLKYGYQCEGLEDLTQKTQVLLKFYQQNPILGIEYQENQVIQSTKSPIQKFEEDIEIVDYEYNQRAQSSIKSYQNNNTDEEIQKQKGRIIFSQELGLAIEEPADGSSLEDLWKIIKINK